MSDDQFTKLFKYVQDMDRRIELRFDYVNNRIDTLTGAVDAYAKQSET